MEEKAIYSKTARGFREVVNKTRDISRDLHSVLALVDGKSDFQTLLKALEGYSEQALQQALSELIDKGYLRDPQADPAPSAPPGAIFKSPPLASPDDNEFDFTATPAASATDPTEDQARRRAEQADEIAQRQAEQEQARKKAEALIRQEFAAKAREEESLAQRQAESQAAAEAAEQQRREIWATSRMETKILAQRKAREEQAKRDAEALIVQEAEAQIRRETEAQEQADADAMSKDFAVTTPLSDRQSVHQIDIDWTSGIASTPTSVHHPMVAGRATKDKKARRTLALVAVFALLVGVIVLQFVSFDERLSTFEKKATAQFRQPVKAKSLHFRLLPTPHWRLQDVTIGDQGQIRIALVKAKVPIAALFSSRQEMTALDAESAILNAEGVAWILMGRAQARSLGFLPIEVKGVQVRLPFGTLPNFDAKAMLDEQGNWRKIELRTPGQKFHAELEATDNGARVMLNAATYTVPLSLDSASSSEPEKWALRNFLAVGMLANKEFLVSEFSGEIYGGYISGKARLNWSSGWILNGEAQAKLLDTAVMFPALSEGGLLSGSGTFAMQAADPALLASSASAEGKFLVERGVLHGIDLGQALRGLSSGGRTPYTTLDGKFSYGYGTMQLRNVRMVDGLMTTTGNADITADKTISSRFSVELKSNSIHVRRAVSMTGTVDAPQFDR